MTQGKRYTLEWTRLFDRLCHAHDAVSKLSLPLWSPAIWPGDCRREGVEPIEVCALVLDLDHGGTLSGGVGAISSGPMACLHTSWRHQIPVEVDGKTVKEDRFRLVFPLATTVATPRYPVLWRSAERWMREEHGLRIDGQAKDAGRSWFIPARAPGAAFYAHRHDGPLLDPWELVARWPTLQAAPPLRSTRAPTPHRELGERELKLKRASACLRTLPPSISGSEGHVALWKAALALVKGFELDPADARDMLLGEFNPRCQPPWSQREIDHKVRSAMKADRTPAGFLGDRVRKVAK